MLEDRENTTPATLDAIELGQRARERDRQVREMQSREERERAAREEREREIQELYANRAESDDDDDQRPAKRQRGTGDGPKSLKDLAHEEVKRQLSQESTSRRYADGGFEARELDVLRHTTMPEGHRSHYGDDIIMQELQAMGKHPQWGQTREMSRYIAAGRAGVPVEDVPMLTDAEMERVDAVYRPAMREQADSLQAGREYLDGIDLRPSKRQRGEGQHYGGHYVGAKTGKATASQVSKYKHTHPNTQTEGARGAYVREGGMVVHRRGKAPSKAPSPKAKSKPKEPSPKPRAKANAKPKTPSPRAPTPPSPQALSPIASPPRPAARKQPKRAAKKSKSRGDQSIFDNKPDSPPPRAKVVDKRKETAERRRREAEEAARPTQRKRKAVNPDVAKARAALKENKYRTGGLGDFKRFWDQRTVSEKRKLTQAEAKQLWDRQRAYESDRAERKADRQRDAELERAVKGMQSERWREAHSSKIPKQRK